MVPNGKPIAVPRSQAGHERRHSCARHVHLAHRVQRGLAAALVQRVVERLADREQADRDQHHLDAVEELGDAAGVAHLAGDLVEADQPDARPMNSAVMPRSVLLPSTALTVVKASSISMKYSGGPSLTA